MLVVKSVPSVDWIRVFHSGGMGGLVIGFGVESGLMNTNGAFGAILIRMLPAIQVSITFAPVSKLQNACYLIVNDLFTEQN